MIRRLVWAWVGVLTLGGCRSAPIAPASAPAPVSLAMTLERAQVDLSEGHWAKAWVEVANQPESSVEKDRFLNLLTQTLVDAKAASPPGGLSAHDREASLSLIRTGTWVPPAPTVSEPEDSHPAQWPKGMATIIVNRGLKVENGVSQPDIVIGSGFFIAADGYLLTNHHVIESEVEIHRPAAAIYPYLVEPDSLRRWVGGLASDSVLTDGGLRVGQRSLEVMESRGGRIALDCLVTGFERDHRLDMLISHPMITLHQRFYLVEAGDSTRVHYSGKVHYRSLLGRFFEPITTPGARKKIGDDLAALKRVAEAGGPVIKQE